MIAPASTLSGIGFHRPPASIDLRADRRFTVEVAGVLQLGDVKSAVYVVTVLDVSRSGLRVCCPVPVATGSRAEVSCCDTVIAGEVRYCREDAANEFYVGIKADQGAEGGIDLKPFLEPIARFI
jgi:hypothetical protein